MASVPAPKESGIRFGVFEFDPQTGELRKAGNRVRLRPQAARVLAILAMRPGQVVTREQLKEEIWGSDTFVDFEHGLNLCIRQIRAALDDDADTPRYVETLPRRGYRFIAPVDAAPQQTVGRDRPKASLETGGRSWRTVGALGVAILALALISAVAVPHLRALWSESSGPVRTIAVLPLANLSGDTTQNYFADGITEQLTTNLARMENLRVISATSALRFRSSKESLPAIARALKADAIVEGSVQRAGDRVRITAQLIRASSDQHLWAETYDRNWRDILALQDDIASAIAQQIESRLGGPTPAALPAAPSVSPAAYETYLKANYYLDNWDLSKSIAYYNEAIKLDPNFAPAYAQMARSYFFLAFGEDTAPREGWGKVKEAATLALQKDDRLPAAHGAMALAKLHFDWDFAGAEQEYKRALQLNPNDAEIRHDYAHYLMAMGRVEESETESRRAVELDPMGGSLVGCLCWHSFAARDYDRSIKLAQEVLTAGDDPWERVILGWDYEQEGKLDQAIQEFKRAVDLSKSGALYLASLGHAYATAGRRADAQQVLKSLTEAAKKSYVSPFDMAVIYTALGDKDAAFAWLDKAVAERSTFLVYSKWEPRIDPLRSDPRFNQLLRRIGLPQ